MTRSMALKCEIEAKLAARIPAALSPLAQQSARLLRTGVQTVDDLLGGGLPGGAISEFSGPAGSGRTSLAFSFLAGMSAEAACAWVDVGDTFCPDSAAAAGVRLQNLLLVRLTGDGGRPPRPARTANTSDAALAAPHERAGSHGWSGTHPRGETRGLAPALEAMLSQKAEAREHKKEGTPGFPNRPLGGPSGGQAGLGSASQEQIEWERFNSRKVDEGDPLRRMDLQAAAHARTQAGTALLARAPVSDDRKQWGQLDRAIRATDQIMQSNGFRLVVLDLLSVAPEQALRIPAATWFRFRRAAQEGDLVLLVLTQQTCAGSSAACVLECSPAEVKMSSVMTGTAQSVGIARQRVGQFGKKTPGRVASWTSSPAWMRATGR